MNIFPVLSTSVKTRGKVVLSAVGESTINMKKSIERNV